MAQSNDSNNPTVGQRHVHCVCGGFGFPIGTASTKRVMLVGRALESAGVLFHVWHIGPSSFPENTGNHGEQDGITWEYLSPSTKRPENRFLRLLYFIYGCLLLPVRLLHVRRKISVYLYYQGDVIDLWTLLLCRLLDIPVAQECCEWWPGTPAETRFHRWMYQRIMFRWSTGALPISDLIRDRIRDIAHKSYPVFKVPVLVDADEVRQQCTLEPTTSGAIAPYLFWCGMVDGYLKDPLFLIRSLGLARRQLTVQPRLILAGPCSHTARKILVTESRKSGIPPGHLIITDFIPEVELFRLATHSTVTLLPLWNDDRSHTRFPTKLGLYAAAGNPIISSPVGEVSNFLQDGQTALLAHPGDEIAWANCICRLLQDEILHKKIKEQILLDVVPRFDYKSFGTPLKEWFSELTGNGVGPR